MDQNQLTQLELLIGRLDTRLSRIERQLGMRDETATPPALPAEKPVSPKAFSEPDEYEVEESEESGERGPKLPSNILGIVGVACLILAMILLIKFSIDSGWLTPVRQVLLATVFGGALIAAPFVLKLSDKAYLSLLPAGGVVILHLTNFGAIFVHQLLHPWAGILAVWAIGFLSLWLLNRFRHDVYGLLAIGGTYIGSALVKVSFPSLIPVAINLLVWDIIFTGHAIRLKSRLLICITAYFSLGIVGLYQGLDSASLISNAGMFAILQFLQIVVYAVGTAAYSLENKTKLSEKEAWQLFPVFLFFYGIEFGLLDSINPLFATIFSIAFSLALLGIYFFTRNRSVEKNFASEHTIFTLVALMLIHSIYVVNLNDTGKMLAGLIPMAIIGIYGKTLKERRYFGPLILAFVVFGISTFLIVLNPSHLLPAGIIVLGLVYAANFLVGYKLSNEVPLLFLSHGLMALSIGRLGEVVGEIWVAPILVLYAYGALVWGLKWQDKNLGRSAFPVIFFALGRFLFYNFEGLSQGERIITLIVMGAIIYAGGYVYRKIPEKT